jgi:hypothetical protein
VQRKGFNDEFTGRGGEGSKELFPAGECAVLFLKRER